jgi:putative ABC transport system substrate-binding protein
MIARQIRRALLLVVMALPLGVLAQPADGSRLRIATLSDGDEGTNAPLWARFRARLGELGYAEHTRFVIEARWAGGDSKRLPALAGELTSLRPHVIVADGTPAALAAKRASTHIPIVAIRISDPVKAGLVTSLAQPGGNVTGNTVVTAQIAGKWVELLREVAPKTKSIVFLTDTSNAGAMITFRELRERARPLGITVNALEGRTAAEVQEAFAAMERERSDALLVGTNAVIYAQRRRIVEAAARQRIPALYARREYVDAGGLMSYGVNLGAHYSQAADYVHRIAQGAKPGDLPIEQPTRLELVVNAKTAKALGIKVPAAVLLRADRVIE